MAVAAAATAAGVIVVGVVVDGCGYGWGGCGGCGYDCGLSCWSSCCGMSVGYSGCGGCSSCGGGQIISEPAGMPAAPMSPSNSPPAVTPPKSTSIDSANSDSAILTVSVPSDAKVTINGLPTKSTGSERRYVSYGLQPGHVYAYKIKVEIVREGRIVPEEQTVSLTAGAT